MKEYRRKRNFGYTHTAKRREQLDQVLGKIGKISKEFPEVQKIIQVGANNYPPPNRRACRKKGMPF